MTELCPVCETPLESPSIGSGTGAAIRGYSCHRCGRFHLTRSLENELPIRLSENKENRAKISHAIRRAQEANPIAYLDQAAFEKMLEVPLPRPREQADILIRWIADHSPGIGKNVGLSSYTDWSIFGAISWEGFMLILYHLRDRGLLSVSEYVAASRYADDMNVQLTFEGWEHFEQIKIGSVIYRKAFMAMQYGNSILDSIVQDTFKPSTKRAGFELILQNETRRAGLIDNRMRVEIQSADFLIADLTHRNPGAYWEAGYAEGLGKPVIFTCEKSVFDDKKTHFDTNHHLTIVWDEKAPEVAGEELTATIRATLPHLAKMTD